MSGLAVIAVGSVVSLGLFAALAVPWTGSAEAANVGPLAVPVGKIGDVASYTRFTRDAPEAAWNARTVESFAVIGQRDVVDETASSVRSLEVSWKQGAGEVPATTYIDLGSRAVVWRDHVRAEPVSSTSGSDFWYATSEFGPRLSAAWTGSTDASLFWFQGMSLGTGEDLSQALAPMFEDLWGLPTGALKDFETRVTEAGSTGGSPAVQLLMRGLAAIPDVDSSPLAGGWNGGVPFLTANVAPGDEVQFERTLWLSADSSYPVLVEDSILPSTGEARRVLLSLDSVEEGATSIPWTAPIRKAAIEPSRSAASLPYPTEGVGGPACLDLQRALGRVRTEPAFAEIQAWRAAHPQNLLLGMRGACIGDTDWWVLVFAEPSGNGYVVEVHRPDEDAAMWAQGRAMSASFDGPLVTPTFDPAELPRGLVTFAHVQEQWNRFAQTLALPQGIDDIEWGFKIGRPVDLPDGSFVSSSRLRGELSELSELTTGSSQLETVDGMEFWKSTYLNVDAETGEILYAYSVKQEDRPLLGENSAPSTMAPPGWTRATAGQSAAPRSWEAAALVSSSVFAAWLIAFFFPLLKYAGSQAVGALGGYAKLRKQELLDHRLRDHLVEIIRADPGVSASDIARRAGAPWSTVIYHLGVIRKNGLVTSMVDTRHRRFFPIGDVSHGDRGRIAVLRNERTRALLEFIHAEPGSSQVHLGARIGVSRPAVGWHLERLEREGLIERRKAGRAVLVFPTRPLAIPSASRGVAAAG